MSDRFDKLMVELSTELDSIAQTGGDEMIRLSPVEHGNRLEVLCDRLATRSAELASRNARLAGRVESLSLNLALMEQAELIEAVGGRWLCGRCPGWSMEQTTVNHSEECPFSLIDDDEAEPAP